VKRASVGKLPSRLTLPSGRLVQLRPGKSGERAPLERAPDAPLFSEVEAAVAEGRVAITSGGAPLDVSTLVLRDFHVVRAVLARSAIVAEEEVALECRNCAEKLRLLPCASLEIGPWVDDELGDPELDATLPIGEPVDVPPVPMGRVRTAKAVTFEERTAAEARALFAAAAKPPLDVTTEVVRALGIAALGHEKDAARIAEALSTCDDEAFLGVADAFLATHYPLRLGSAVFCETCGARNDVDTPFERELVGRGGEREGVRESGFPGFDGFAARARAIARGMLRAVPGEPVELAIEGGTPAVDDGGEPLLGSYEPGHPGDAGTPSRQPVVTVYYRTFEAMWNEEGAYDWDGELAETIEHELEHHIAFLRGDDPTDDEERAVIRDEAVRIVGRREAGRRAIEDFGASWSDFLKRTWPLWLLALVLLAVMLATQH
jgi:hypothetical protein